MNLKVAASLLTLFVSLPIWYFLVHTMLVAIHPDRLVWFLFWIYMPVGFIGALMFGIAERKR